MSDQFSVPGGFCCITTHGTLQAATAESYAAARSFNDANGLKNIQYAMVPGSLADKVRNDACRTMLKENRGFVFFIDGDMTFAQDAIFKVIQTAYGTHQWADVVGGYCNLRGDLAIPTIDTGTGTWESHYPGSGVKEVIRTGGAFLLIKRHVLERIPDPWFALRVPMRPLDALAEVDSFARQKFDGSNPFQGPQWDALLDIAAHDTSAVKGNFVPAEVGEDSSFCDRVRQYGMRIAVNTDVVTEHLNTVPVNWQTHKKAMKDRERDQRYAVGLMA